MWLKSSSFDHVESKVDFVVFVVCVQKLEEQDRKALNMKEQLQREHRYLKRRLEQLSVSGSVERIRTDSMGSTISTDSEQGTLTTQMYSEKGQPTTKKSQI